MFQDNKRITVLLFLFGLIFLSGCATYQVKRITPELFSLITTEHGIFSISSSILLKEKAESYLGVDPEKSGIIPVFLRIQNKSDRVFKVNFEKTFLLDSENNRYRSIPVEEAIKIAQRNPVAVAGWAAAFGLVGGVISGSQSAEVNRKLEEDYYEKSFKPAIITGKGSAEGVMFFKVPKTIANKEKFRLEIVLRDLETFTTQSIIIQLK